MVGTFGWTLRVHLRPLLRPAKGGERSPYIYLCVCCLCGFVYVSIYCAYVYMYIRFFEFPVSCWATIEFFCQYWILGLDASKFSDPSLSLCPHFFGRHSLVSRLANIRGFWFAMVFSRNPCGFWLFCFGRAPLFSFLHSSFPRMLPHSPPTLRLTMLCIHLEICLYIFFLDVCMYVYVYR